MLSRVQSRTDFPPGGGDDEIHVFHHMSSIELENYTPV